jgi:hypothetical protein
MTPRSRFSKSILWRCDPDELAQMAILVAPTLIMPAICDTFLSIAPYTTDVNVISDNLFTAVKLRDSPDSDLAWSLKNAFLAAYNPLQDQILDITSIHNSDPTPRFKGIIRAHDISEPAFKGIITDVEILAIVHRNYDEYMGYMNRVARGPDPYIDILLLVINPDEMDLYCTQPLSNSEKISRFFASWSARLDLATVYKNYLGLEYPDCKDVSIYFGCPERARELNSQEEAESKEKGFRGVMDMLGRIEFRYHLQLVCYAKLFDDHVVRMTTDVPVTMAHHITYLAMAMFQCRLTDKEGQDAMKRCGECES